MHAQDVLVFVGKYWACQYMGIMHPGWVRHLWAGTWVPSSQALHRNGRKQDGKRDLLTLAYLKLVFSEIIYHYFVYYLL